MKYCDKCEKEFDTAEEKCPVCGAELKEENTDEDTAVIVATMDSLGLL